MARFILSIAQLLAILAFICRAYGADYERPEKLNVIFMVSDGMGPSGMTLARTFKQNRDGLPFGHLLNQEKYFVGQLRSSSNSSYVTDSAGAGTAFACGVKSYNGAIGVDPQGNPCGTVLEAMKLDGYKTGLVTTTRITDATPATLSAHTRSRKGEDSIAQQQLWEGPLNFTNTVDLLLGGGRCFFLPANTTGGCRSDSRNLVSEAKAKGYTYVGDRTEFDQAVKSKNVTLPFLGLLASTDQPYEIDRNATTMPSFAEQSEFALNTLAKATKDSDKGFFVLLEGARIDHAGHDNDPATHVREVLAYDDAFAKVKKFVDSTDVPTIVISVSDHETGGLAVAKQVRSTPDYLWWPKVLMNATHSGAYLSNKIINKYKTINSRYDSAAFANFIAEDVFKGDLGINDYTGEEVRRVRYLTDSTQDLKMYLNKMVNDRSQTGFTTGGHSGGDVNIYAYSNDDYFKAAIYDLDGVVGNHENTDIARIMESFAGVSLEDTTKLLRAGKA